MTNTTNENKHFLTTLTGIINLENHKVALQTVHHEMDAVNIDKEIKFERMQYGVRPLDINMETTVVGSYTLDGCISGVLPYDVNLIVIHADGIYKSSIAGVTVFSQDVARLLYGNIMRVIYRDETEAPQQLKVLIVSSIPEPRGMLVNQISDHFIQLRKDALDADNGGA